MATRSGKPILSAQHVDPLSWFTGPLVPLSLATFAFVYSTILVITNWGVSERPWVQIVAVLLCSSSGVIVHSATRPLRQPIGWEISALAIVPSVVGMLVSAADYSRTSLAVEFWGHPVHSLSRSPRSRHTFRPGWC